MKTLLLFPLAIAFSCTSSSIPNETDTDETLGKGGLVLAVEELSKTDSVIFLKEDSIKFFEACKEEEKLIDQFCACAVKNGRDNVECRDFIKQQTKYQKIEDEIRNKYLMGEFENQIISSLLSKRVKELTNKFNNCGK